MRRISTSANAQQAAQEKQERRAKAARLDTLRQQVRAHLAGMEDTPAPPIVLDGRALLDDLWDKVERNPKTGKRQFIAGVVKGDKTASERLDAEDVPEEGKPSDHALGAFLRSIADFKRAGRNLLIRYHGEDWQGITGEMDYLIGLAGGNFTRQDIRDAIFCYI